MKEFIDFARTVKCPTRYFVVSYMGMGKFQWESFHTMDHAVKFVEQRWDHYQCVCHAFGKDADGDWRVIVKTPAFGDKI